MKISSPLGNESVEITSEFGPRWGRQHKGVDISAKPGTRVTSVLPGKVVKSGNFNDGYGGQVLIKHQTPEGIFYSRYAHLKKMYVKENETVNAGEKIGESGGEQGDPNAGRSTGPHLHFEFMGEGMTPLDPAPYLTSLVSAGQVLSTSSSDNNKETSAKPTSFLRDLDQKNLVDKTLSAVSKVAPLTVLAGLKGASTKKESNENKKLLEELDRIKQLIN
jgi:murein DD-endopeptidase MepM/ murein hydrolase activator NlpD